ncbi:putative uncharacterized protein DDB_G0286901 isoform X2 [Euwallacea fornicatus]|uniref:putative uncharacterized protein DDB_G0286901 isoform X2 n=1 Tax=Euwallacea fornicatus TaxID=995702 RepID=UPI0033904E9B
MGWISCGFVLFLYFTKILAQGYNYPPPETSFEGDASQSPSRSPSHGFKSNSYKPNGSYRRNGGILTTTTENNISGGVQYPQLNPTSPSLATKSRDFVSDEFTSQNGQSDLRQPGGFRGQNFGNPALSDSDSELTEAVEGDYSAIPGQPDQDYPVLSSVPETSFSCEQQEYPGYYADIETRCQVFHICVNNKTYDFLCPNGTIFHQEYLVCVWWNLFDCTSAPSFYSINSNIYDYSIKGAKQQTGAIPAFGENSDQAFGTSGYSQEGSTSGGTSQRTPEYQPFNEPDNYLSTGNNGYPEGSQKYPSNGNPFSSSNGVITNNVQTGYQRNKPESAVPGNNAYSGGNGYQSQRLNGPGFSSKQNEYNEQSINQVKGLTTPESVSSFPYQSNKANQGENDKYPKQKRLKGIRNEQKYSSSQEDFPLNNGQTAFQPRRPNIPESISSVNNGYPEGNEYPSNNEGSPQGKDYVSNRLNGSGFSESYQGEYPSNKKGQTINQQNASGNNGEYSRRNGYLSKRPNESSGSPSSNQKKYQSTNSQNLEENGYPPKRPDGLIFLPSSQRGYPSNNPNEQNNSGYTSENRQGLENFQRTLASSEAPNHLNQQNSGSNKTLGSNGKIGQGHQYLPPRSNEKGTNGFKNGGRRTYPGQNGGKQYSEYPEAQSGNYNNGQQEKKSQASNGFRGINDNYPENQTSIENFPNGVSGNESGNNEGYSDSNLPPNRQYLPPLGN